AQFPGCRLQRHHAVGVEVRSFAIAAIETIRRIAGRKKGQTPLAVNRDPAPETGAASVLPAVRSPRIISGLTRMGRQVESPRQFSRAQIVGSGVAARTAAWPLRSRRP